MDGLRSRSACVRRGADDLTRGCTVASERWRTIQSIFYEALDLDASERGAYLDAVCEGDNPLRDEVESLLRSAETYGPFDELVTQLEPPAARTADDELRRGDRVDAYRVLEKVGEGGMGVVYLAERADGQFEQRVALKVVKRTAFNAPLVRNFLNERSILARLTHPNIARLYDGGVLRGPEEDSVEARPYFVMEFVEGVPLDRYCDAQRLDVTARLHLFCRIVEAVQFAHQKMVVHLDLKPSNVLVDRAGEVKLLDFGVARLLAAPTKNEASSQTSGFAGAATPEYAAPEQLEGGPVSAATDVYALGIILHELLTGGRPRFRSAMEGGGPLVSRFVRPSSLVRLRDRSDVVRTESADPGSRTRSASPQTSPQDGGVNVDLPRLVERGMPKGDRSDESRAADPAFARSTTAERLQRRLSGDLDAMILKALHEEPGRRYGSAGQLADDIRRHLGGWPINARPQTLGYRSATFIRRHRSAVAAAMLIAVSFLAGIAGTAWQAHIAAEQRDHARLAEAKAQRVSTFLIDLFKLADPSEARGDTVTARELLARGAARVEAELKEQPTLQADMMHVMGQVYLSLGLLSDARPLLEHALAMRRSEYEVPHADIAASLHQVAELDYLQGLFENGEGRFTEALAMRRHLFGVGHPDVAASMHGLGVLLSDAGRLDEADSLLKEAVALRRSFAGAPGRDLAQSVSALALVLHRKSSFEEAEDLFREAVELGRGAEDDLSPVRIASLRNLARLVHHFDRDYDAAEPMYREALEMSRRLYGDRHSDVAVSLSDLAQVLRDRGDYDAAESVAREGLALWTSTYGERHIEVATSADILARVLWLQGETADAEAIYRRTLAMRRELLGDDHPRIVSALQTLATLLLETGRYTESERLYADALEKSRALYGEDHAYNAVSLRGLAELHEASGDLEGAESYFRHALSVRQRLHDAGHWRIAEAKSELAACLTARGSFEEAERLLQESYPVLLEERGEEDPATIQALEHIKALYERIGTPSAARDPLGGADPTAQ